MKILTVHGWAFCPQVFSPLEALGNTEHYLLEYSSLKEETLKVAQKIDPQTVVVGWSLGATVAVLASSLKKPKGLLLIGATPNFGKAWKREYIERFLKELRENFEEKIKDFRLSVWGEDICQKIPLEKEKTINLLKEFIETDISQEVKNLNLPTILLHGKRDPITPFREAKKMLKLNPRLKLLPYDGGHFPKNFTPGDWKQLFQSFQQL